MTKGFEPNMKRYRQAAEPHESNAAAEIAITAFYAELGELRVKHKIKDLLVVYGVNVLDENGDEGCKMGTTAFGTQSLFESMAAMAYGVHKERNAAMMRELLKGNL